MYHDLGISSLDQLREACEAGKVRKLKGFGAKTEQAILDGLAIAAQAGVRTYWAEADQIARSITSHLEGCGAIEQMEVAGSYRRGKETVGDLDILVVAADRDP
ncbi:MAG TPA: DNA polymerase/3'-5' exonuclease PolX, partial [Planctomycetaceae bacterium]|nr:DNA polymerase/3'-5' exonuclease PolX [Planctomycetaceae bacterium]